MISKKFTSLFFVSLVVVWPLMNVAEARSRPVPVITPDPIAYGNVSVTEVGKRIRRVLAKRRWVMKRVNSTYVRASYEKSNSKRTLMASVNIRYGGGKIRFSYHDSTGFAYDARSKTIHRKYNSWVRNIYRDLLVEFGDY